MGKDYGNIKIVVNKYLFKINMSFIDNLKRTFLVKLQKFSTLITKEKMENLENKLLAQYYQIESFINERVNLIHELIYNLTEILNNTKEVNQIIGELFNQKANLYYDIFSDNIQSKYQIIEKSEFISPKFSNDNIEEDEFDFYLNSVNSMNYYISSVDNYLYDLEHETDKSFGFHLSNKPSNFNISSIPIIGKPINTLKNLYKSITDFFDVNIYNKSYSINIPFFYPNLYLTITKIVKLGTRLDIYPIMEDKEYGISTDLYIRGEVSMEADVGYFIPDKQAAFQMSLRVGIKGTLASGRIGMRINLYLKDLKYETDLYFVFNALVFEFYAKFTIFIQIWIFEFFFEFYLIRFIYSPLSIEKHIKDSKFFIPKKKFLFENRLKGL